MRSESTLDRWLVWLRASTKMSLVATWRLVFSRQSLICLSLLLFAALATWAMAQRQAHVSPQRFTRVIVMGLYLRLLLPLLCLCFAASSIANDREQRTLVYVLSSPVPRVIIYLSRFVFTLLMVLCWTVGGFVLLGALARVDASLLWTQFVPIMAAATAAYVAMFQLFSVIFRRPTILALIYVLLFETLVGALPGTAKRMTISFYNQCLIIAAGKSFGFRPWGRQHAAEFETLFQPVSADVALWTLFGVTLVLVGTAAIFFSRNEY